MNAKQRAGSKGGQACVSKHGREHMREIGKKGAATTWQRYYLAPLELANYAMVDRATGRVIAFW